MEANQEAQSAKADVRMALERLQLHRKRLEDARRDYQYALERAHKTGASVIDIAHAAGISRTAVYKQLGKR